MEHVLFIPITGVPFIANTTSLLETQNSHSILLSMFLLSIINNVKDYGFPIYKSAFNYTLLNYYLIKSVKIYFDSRKTQHGFFSPSVAEFLKITKLQD